MSAPSVQPMPVNSQRATVGLLWRSISMQAVFRGQHCRAVGTGAGQKQ